MVIQIQRDIVDVYAIQTPPLKNGCVEHCTRRWLTFLDLEAVEDEDMPEGIICASAPMESVAGSRIFRGKLIKKN